jgi:pimeloyl-ACP methyl ester carboxylesterase
VSSERARERIASRTTVCSYDRAGMGWSDPSSGPVTVGMLARDLAVLQDRARLRWPFVLVASSVGGLTAEMFARQFPERVAGLVFLDAPNSLALAQGTAAEPWMRPATCASGVLAHLGVIRLLDPFGLAAEASEAGRRGAALTYSARPWNQLCRIARGLPATIQEFERAAPLPPDLPVTVLIAASRDDLAPPIVTRFVDSDVMQAALGDNHQQLAKLSAHGRSEVVPDSTHLIANSQPEAVADAVFAMLEQVK